MKIGVDLHDLTRRGSGGMVPLAEALLAGFGRAFPEHSLTLFCSPRSADLFADGDTRERCVVLSGDSTHEEVEAHALRVGVDVLLRTHPGQVVGTRYPMSRQVVLITEMIHEFWPGFYSRVEADRHFHLHRRILEEVGAVVTVSEVMRDAMIENCWRKCQHIFLMRPALPANIPVELTSDEEAMIPVGRYFIYPANLWAHKNHRLVLKAFDQFQKRTGEKIEFVFTGEPTGWETVTDGFGHLPLRHLGWVDRALMMKLLARAEALIHFSLFESFSLPVLEAFQAGTPVLCGDVGVMPELGGEAVLACSPTDVGAMAELMRRITSDSNLRETLIARGRQRLAEVSAQESLEVLRLACETVEQAHRKTTGPNTDAPVAVALPPTLRMPRRWWKVHKVPMFLKERIMHQVQLLRDHISRKRERARELARARTQGKLPREFDMKPRLGVLDQHKPLKLVCPESYHKITPPRNAPVVSIVTPAYNHERWLERTIQSVLGQGYPNLEYIVQDGGSTDGTGEILDRYRSRLKHCESKRDRGQTHAINLGFAHATGEIMAYLNSDDLLLPGALAHVTRYFARHPEVDVVYGHRVLIDANDDEIGRWVLPPHSDAALLWADYVPQETLFWRRRIWDKAGATMDESFQFAMDWDLLARFWQAGARFARIPRFLGAFRVLSESKTGSQMADLGMAEMHRIRRRIHGRVVSCSEVGQRLQNYLKRSAIHHELFRFGVLLY